jgi:hypothetical protein
MSKQQEAPAGTTTLTTPSDREIVSEPVFDAPASACSRLTPTRS